MTAPEIVGDRLRVTFGAPSEAHVPGWWRCPCGVRFHDSSERDTKSVPWHLPPECGACGSPMEPILQPERGERERTPRAVLASEVEG